MLAVAEDMGTFPACSMSIFQPSASLHAAEAVVVGAVPRVLPSLPPPNYLLDQKSRFLWAEKMLHPQLRPDLYSLHIICFPQPQFKTGGAEPEASDLPVKGTSSQPPGPLCSLAHPIKLLAHQFGLSPLNMAMLLLFLNLSKASFPLLLINMSKHW